MRRMGLLGLALAAWALPARAEMPNYDVKAHCTQIASYGGSLSQSLLQTCYQQEQSAYDALKPSWDQLPAAMRQHCNQIASYGGTGSFSLLRTCVQQENAAARQNGEFQFRR